MTFKVPALKKGNSLKYMKCDKMIIYFWWYILLKAVLKSNNLNVFLLVLHVYALWTQIAVNVT